MATLIFVNTGSGNGLLPVGTKPLPEPMLTYHRRCSCSIKLRAISQVLKNAICKLCLEKTFFKLLAGDNELIYWTLNKHGHQQQIKFSNAFYFICQNISSFDTNLTEIGPLRSPLIFNIGLDDGWVMNGQQRSAIRCCVTCDNVLNIHTT